MTSDFFFPLSSSGSDHSLIACYQTLLWKNDGKDSSLVPWLFKLEDVVLCDAPSLSLPGLP